MRRFVLPAALGLAALVAAPVVAQEQADDLQTRISDMHDRFEAAYNAGDASGVAGFYAEDAVAMAPLADRVEGRDAIEKFFTTEFQERSPSELSIESVEARQIGETVVDTGTYRITAEGPGGERMPVTGDYLALLEQDEDGQWRIVSHIWNQDIHPEAVVGEQ